MDGASGHTLFPTAIGVCGMAWGPAGITAVQLPEQDPEATRARLLKHAGPSNAVEEPPDEIRAAITGIQALLDGEPRQLLELERKMAVTKKRAFERWVAKSLKRRSQAQRAEKRRFSRDRWLKEWQEWSLDPVTRNALLPISGLVLLAGLGGWFIGSQQFCRPLILQPGVQQLR